MYAVFTMINGRGTVAVLPSDVLWIETVNGATVLVLKHGTHKRRAVRERAEVVLRRLDEAREMAA